MTAKEIVTRSSKNIWQKWSIAFKVLPVLIFVGVLKFLSHKYGFEVLDLNPLFTSLVAGTIFLIGFLISGVLSDYKESEKIPSELAASIKTMYDDAYTISKVKNSETASMLIEFQKAFVNSLIDWFYNKEDTQSILKKLSQMNDFFVEFEKEGVQAGFIIKMKNEQVSLRKMVLRIATIRDTNFIGSAYAIVEAMGFLTGSGLILIKMQPFFASLIFTLLVTFLISYMVLLIKDIDNPFDYSLNGESGTEVSLKPIHELNIEFNSL